MVPRSMQGCFSHLTLVLINNSNLVPGAHYANLTLASPLAQSAFESDGFVPEKGMKTLADETLAC